MIFLFLIALLQYINVNSSILKDALVISSRSIVITRSFIKRLCDLDYSVTILDDISTENRYDLQYETCNIYYNKVDYKQYFTTSNGNIGNVDLLIHLGSVVEDEYDIDLSPIHYLEQNTLESLSFSWIIANKFKLSKVLYLTSYIVNTYVNDLAHQYDISIHCIKSWYSDDQHVSPFYWALDKVLQRHPSIEIPIDKSFDFIHVDDVVNCVFDSISLNNHAHSIVVGSGVTTSMSGLATMIADSIGYNIKTHIIQSQSQSDINQNSKFCTIQIKLQQGIERSIRNKASNDIKRALRDKAMKDDHAQIKTSDRSKYSSMQCTGGNQQIHCSQFQKHFSKFPHANNPRVRTCKFQNVCYINGQVIFYADNSTARNLFNPSKFTYDDDVKRNKMLISSLHEVPFWSPMVQFSPLPSDIPFSKNNNAFLYETRLASNFGHFLVDDMMSIVVAMDLFNLDEDSIGTYIHNFCNHPLTVKSNDEKRCQLMYENLFGYVFDTKKLTLLNSTEKICFKNLFIGHEIVFGQNNFQLGRAGYFRRFRDRVVARAGLTNVLNSKPRNHKIIVLTKEKRSTYGNDKYLKLYLCDMVQSFAETVSPQPEVVCLSNVSVVPFQEQLKLSLSATIVISEHGTLAYFSLFTRTGAVAIVISPMDDEYGIKDSHIFLHMTHCQFFYLRSFGEGSERDPTFEVDLFATLMHSLYITSDNFELSMSLLVADTYTSISSRLNMLIDTASYFPVADSSGRTETFEILYNSHDRCTSTYNWCLSNFGSDKKICEDIYIKVKKLMKHHDDKHFFDCYD